MPERGPEDEKAHGRFARSPGEIPPKGFRDVALRVKQQAEEDNLFIVAAGIAYYAFLALFPAAAALISIYGLVADPDTIQQQFNSLAGILPADAHELLKQQIQQIAGRPAAVGWGLVLSIVLALWSANSGMTALFKGVNISYDQRLRRSFVRGTALTLAFTMGAIVIIILSMALIVGLPVTLQRINFAAWLKVLLSVVQWAALAMLIIFSLAALYRYAPDRRPPKWRWVTWGSVTSAVLWLIGSWGFSYYVAHFGNYNKTYGSLAAVVILLFWLFLTSFIILLGAEINAEMEHQTRRDSTTGAEKPLGERGAYSADDVGDSPP